MTARCARAAAVAAAVLLAGCAGSHAVEPTVPSVDFRPRLVLEVGDDGLHWQRGPRAADDVDLAHPTVRRGAVIEVANTGRDPHRVAADSWFDTGTIEPGDRTVVALTKESTDPQTVVVTDQDDPGRTATIVVEPTPP